MTGGKGKRLGYVAIQHSQPRTRRGARRQALERGKRKRSAQASARGASGRAGRGTRRGVRATCAHRLGQLGQLVARAPSLVFRPGFRLGTVSESPFGPGS